MEACFDAAIQAIDNQNRQLRDLGSEIWRNPELGNQEIQAHKIISAFLRENGFDVEEQFQNPTGFRACFGSKKEGESACHACLLCEYDALPQVGHASGHNLVAEVCVAAAVGIKVGIEAGGKAVGKVTVIGTPDKENNGTKTELINSHFFKDVDIAMTIQPYIVNIAKPIFLQNMRVQIKYEGKTSHASCQPWEARNALDAAVLCYNNISVLRQQLKPHMQVHAIINNGGVRPNIIPGETEMKVFLRARDHTDMAILTQKATAAFVAAGKATGCETVFDFTDTPYSAVQSNSKLAEVYQRQAERLGMDFTIDEDLLTNSCGSTDTGNVSHIVPTIIPAYAVGTDAAFQSEGFAEAVGTDGAHEASIVASKALALTALEVMSNDSLLEEIKSNSRGDSPTLPLTAWP